MPPAYKCAPAWLPAAPVSARPAAATEPERCPAGHGPLHAPLPLPPERVVYPHYSPTVIHEIRVMYGSHSECSTDGARIQDFK